MNLVSQIMDQLSGECLENLCSELGTDPEKTVIAARAAVPALLSALANMAGNDKRANHLADLLDDLDSSSLGNIGSWLSSNPQELFSKGSNLLEGLLGPNLISNLATAISRYTGLNPATIKRLLSYITPLVLGKVAAQWKGQDETVHGLKDLFADQREYIEDSAPAGFSLATIPGLANLELPTNGNTWRPQQSEHKSSARWLVPAAVLLVGGFLLWRFWPQQMPNEAVAERAPASQGDEVTAMRPVLPADTELAELPRLQQDLTGLFESLDQTLAKIHDPASAEQVLPQLTELQTKIEAASSQLEQLSESRIADLRPMIDQHSRRLAEQAKATYSIEGLSEEFKARLQEIIARLTTWFSDQNL